MESEELDALEVKRRRWPLWKRILLGLGCLGFVPLLLIHGLLASMIVPDVVKRVCSGSAWKAKADIVAITDALDSFAIENEGRYPETLLPLVTPDASGFTFLSIDHVPKDPWGREYEYLPPNPLRPEFIVRTLGSDGDPGGSGEAQDIDNLSIQSGKL